MCAGSGRSLFGHIRIYHEFVDRIDNSVPRFTVWHHEASRVMPNSDPRDRFVYPFLKFMLNSFLLFLHRMPALEYIKFYV